MRRPQGPKERELSRRSLPPGPVLPGAAENPWRNGPWWLGRAPNTFARELERVEWVQGGPFKPVRGPIRVVGDRRLGCGAPEQGPHRTPPLIARPSRGMCGTEECTHFSGYDFGRGVYSPAMVPTRSVGHLCEERKKAPVPTIFVVPTNRYGCGIQDDQLR